MKKEELDKRIAKLNVKMNDLGDKAKDSVETAKIEGMYAKDKLDDEVAKTKGDVVALRENFRLLADRAKSKVSSELLRTQMNIDVAKEKLAEKKEARDKAKMEEYIEDMVEYAEACLELSILAAEEAKLATLEAIDAQAEYEDLYGTEEE